MWLYYIGFVNWLFVLEFRPFKFCGCNFSFQPVFFINFSGHYNHQLNFIILKIEQWLGPFCRSYCPEAPFKNQISHLLACPGGIKLLAFYFVLSFSKGSLGFPTYFWMGSAIELCHSTHLWIQCCAGTGMEHCLTAHEQTELTRGCYFLFFDMFLTLKCSSFRILYICRNMNL